MIEFVSNIPDGDSCGVCVVLIDKWTNKFYLAERKGNYETGKYAVPGGMVEENEDILSALIRETKEETGVQLLVPKINFITVAKHEGAKSNYTIWFKYYIADTDVPKNLEPHKHGEWKLYSKVDALKLPLMLSTREVLINYI